MKAVLPEEGVIFLSKSEISVGTVWKIVGKQEDQRKGTVFYIGLRMEDGGD